ncbi:MAG: hypothetical protein ACE5FU_05250 [Nitrospinota bacterium]
MSDRIVFSRQLPTIEKMADLLVEEAMDRSRGDVQSAAELLDISVQRLKQHLKKLGKTGFRKAVFYTLTLLALLFSPQHSEASYSTYEGVTSTFSFASGVVFAYGVHELGHLGAAWATDSYIKFEAGTYNQPIGFTEDVDSDSDGMILNASGLVTQAVGSEVILQTDRINKNSNFVRGIMAWNILNPISYAIDFWFIRRSNKKFKNSYQGDIQGIEFYAGKRSANSFSVGIIAISLVQGFRFLQTQEWMKDLVGDSGEAFNNFHLRPLNQGGVLLSYQLKF